MDEGLYNAAIEGRHGIFNKEESEVLVEQYFVERTNKGDNILHLAAKKGHRLFIEVALQKIPASVLLICQKNQSGENPLHVAAEHGYLEVARLLVDGYHKYKQDVEGARRRSSLLSLTIAEEGVAQEPWRDKDSHGQTPLHKALATKKEELAVYLLEEDPELASYDTDGDEGPLYLAAAFGLQTFAEKILMSSQSYSLNGPGGATPLHAAVYATPAENIVQLLLQKHPELIRKADIKKETALHHAAQTNQAGIADMILRADSLQTIQDTTVMPGAEISSVNQRDINGLTPLLGAANLNLVNVVIAILRNSPKSMAICNYDGKSALHLMRLTSHHEGSILFGFPIVQRLVNETDHEGNTPLHLAVKRQDNIMATLLLDTVNIQTNFKNRDGHTPRDLVKSQKELSDDMVEIGYQLIMQERQRQIFPEPETILGVATSEEIPERSPQAIQQRTPTEVCTRILDDTNKNLQHSFNTISVISAILAAVTFATIFATPGGFNSEGHPILESKVLFKVYILSNASAMCGYVLVLFCMLWAIRITQHGDEPRLLLSFSIYVLQLSFYATLAAFATASYAFISATTFWLAVVLVCIPGCVIILTLPKFLLLWLAKMLLRFHVRK